MQRDQLEQDRSEGRVTDPDEWQTGTAGGRLTRWTVAGAELVHVKSKSATAKKPAEPHGLACAHCGAERRPISTRDELLAFQAEHVHCRPVWATARTP